MADERLQLTVSLERTGSDLRASYYDGKTQPIGAAATVNWASIGTDFVYSHDGGSARGIDGINAALDRGDMHELIHYFTRERLVEVGHILFTVLFGNSERWEPVLRELFNEHSGPRPNPPRYGVRVRISTSVKELVDIPWRLCAWKGKFLADSGWTFEVVTYLRPSQDVEFETPCPILVMAPTFRGMDDIGTAQHLQALRQALPEQYHTAAYFRVVKTRAETRDAFLGMNPRLVYYYGHAELQGQQLCLLLGDEDDDVERVIADDFKRTVAGHFPQMAYINACKSGTGGWFSMGYQLSPEVPVVIANATTSWSEYAGPSAISFLRKVLANGHDPVIAAHELDELTSTRGFEWAMRTINANYRTWKAEPLASMGPLTPIGLRLDRDSSRERALSRVADLVRSDEHRVMTLIAYADEGNRVDLVHQQIKDHLEDHAYHLAQITWRRVNFPEGDSPAPVDLEQSLAHSLDAAPGEPITYALRRSARGLAVAGTATPIVWLDWGVFGHPYGRIIRRNAFMRWIEYASELAQNTPADIRVIAYMGFEIKNAAHAKLEDLIRDQALRSLANSAFSVELIPPLPRLHTIDIAKFLQDRNNTRCPPELVMDMAKLLYEKTAGQYAETLEYIETAERDGWFNLFRSLSPKAGPSGSTDTLF